MTKKEKGGHLTTLELRISVCDHQTALHALCPCLGHLIPTAGNLPRTACSVAADEAALIVIRFYISTSPPARVDQLGTFRNRYNRLIPPLVSLSLVFLSIVLDCTSR